MFITPAFAQGALFGLGGDSGGMIVQFMPLILIIAIMYFLILRPQQRKVKLHQDMVNRLGGGFAPTQSAAPRKPIARYGGLLTVVTKVEYW